MSILLQLVGFIWAAVGVISLWGLDWQDPEAATVNGVAILFAMLLFILPGLVVGGMGSHMSKKKKRQQP